MAYDLFLYSVLINMDPVNMLYFFDWMILINTEYVIYSMCMGVYVWLFVHGCLCVVVCVLTFMFIEYILLYIRYKFSFFFIIQITIYNPDYYILCSHCLSVLQPIHFFSNIF